MLESQSKKEGTAVSKHKNKVSKGHVTPTQQGIATCYGVGSVKEKGTVEVWAKSLPCNSRSEIVSVGVAEGWKQETRYKQGRTSEK